MAAERNEGMTNQQAVWDAVKRCSETVEPEWAAILAEAGLTAEQTQKAWQILAEMELLSEGPKQEGMPLKEIGGYRIRRKIAEGGMGVVFEAEQDSPRRAVALKTLRAGEITLTMLKRFELEARALGRLNHPGIAQIFEASIARTPLGELPYFAMELVEGLPLLDFAQRAGFGQRERVELIRKVCEAVEHAHDLGIVHRDLKPSNILVTPTGQPKVLDFGVASLAQSGQVTQVTAAGELLGTLAYMSPEQVKEVSQAADVRTDVYALGVMLYELISGKAPYKLAGLHLAQAAVVIGEQEPEPLTSRSLAISQDLATIIGKTLEKEKQQRYQSVAALREDLSRFLEDRPILAKPATQWDQLTKFARRNRPLVLSLAAVLIVLIAATAVSTWQALRAREAERTARSAEQQAIAERDRTLVAERSAVEARDQALQAQKRASEERDRAVAAELKTRQERQRADQETANAKAISDFLQDDLLAMASPEMQAGGTAGVKPDPDLKVRTALDRAATRIENQFRNQPVVEAAIRQTMGNTYLRLGLAAEARKQMEKALEIRRRELGNDNLDTLRSMHNLAWLLQEQKQYAAAQPIQEQILEIRTRLLGEKHPDTMRAMNNLAGSYLGQTNIAKAQPLFERLLPVISANFGAENPSTLVVMNNLAVLSGRLGKFAEAERTNRKLLEIRTRTLGEEHPDTLVSINNLAVSLLAQKRGAEAEAMFEKAWKARSKVLGPKHPQTLSVEFNLATSREQQGNLDKAEEIQRAVYDSRKSALGELHLDTLETLTALARVRILRGDFVGAEAAARAATAGYEKSQAKVWQRWFAQVLLGQSLIGQSLIGQSLMGQAKYAEAKPILNNGTKLLLEAESLVPVSQRPFSLDLARKWFAALTNPTAAP